MKNKYFAYIACFTLLTLFLAGCTKEASQKPEQTITDKSLQNIKDRGKLIVGTYGEIPYITFLDESKNFAGYDTEIARDIASKLEVSVEFRKMSFPEMFTAVKKGDVDILMSVITITPERSLEMLFSIPYFQGGQALMVRKDNPSIKSIEDLLGKKIGVLKGTTGESATLSLPNISKSTVISYENSASRNPDLISGKIDVAVEDYVGLVGYVKEDSSLMIAGEPFTQEYYGIVTKLGNDALMDEINKILRDMKRTGRLDEIKKKWMN
ncbi:MAG: ABC transporter substrate-binding protein [archaeon]